MNKGKNLRDLVGDIDALDRIVNDLIVDLSKKEINLLQIIYICSGIRSIINQQVIQNNHTKETLEEAFDIFKMLNDWFNKSNDKQLRDLYKKKMEELNGK